MDLPRRWEGSSKAEILEQFEGGGIVSRLVSHSISQSISQVILAVSLMYGQTWDDSI
jgi:hypothetical protein